MIKAIVGCQWGDEGKGKIIDHQAQNADVIVRCTGGANAGHTVVLDDKKSVVRLLPSAILCDNRQFVLGQGMVIDLEILLEEMKLIKPNSNLLISDKAHIVMPYHKIVDAFRESQSSAIGTTKKGIGPAYEDKIARRGIRFEDFRNTKELFNKVQRAAIVWNDAMCYWGGMHRGMQVNDLFDYLMSFSKEILPFIGDVPDYLQTCLKMKKRILLEGAQGTFLDIDHGTYPFVTSSNCTIGGMIASAGVGPKWIDDVIGVVKAYTTRVGGGPFPTELFDEIGNYMRVTGNEYGSVTGRPRRCGWLDIPMLRNAVMLNGLTKIAITKLDILSELDEIKICINYKSESDGSLSPVYKTLPGWKKDISGIKSFRSLPKEAKNYLVEIEEQIDCPIGFIGTGADRNDFIWLTTTRSPLKNYSKTLI